MAYASMFLWKMMQFMIQLKLIVIHICHQMVILIYHVYNDGEITYQKKFIKIMDGIMDIPELEK